MSGFQTQATPGVYAGGHNGDDFVFNEFMARVWTSIPCVVKAVTPSGVMAGIGTVAVQPAINLADGAGNTQPHGTIPNVPYFRIQGGTNGIVCDPAAGDNGILFVMCRDSSAFKRTQAIANPGSGRVFDLSDSFYFGGTLNAALTQYVQFTSNKVIVNATSEVDVSINGTLVGAFTSSGLSVTGTISATGNITAGHGTGDAVDMQGHTHLYSPGSGTPTQTASPTAGT